MTIRTFQPGDESAQVSIYNEAAADLPRFKQATLDEVRRRCAATDFDPTTRLYATSGNQVVGYCTFAANGRVGYPWCRKGHESLAEPLFHQALEAMKARGITKAHTAYRGDWASVLAFFQAQGFTQAREMVNFVLDLVDMPTPAARPGSTISPLTPADVPAVLQMGASVLRLRTAEELEKYLFHNRYFPPSSLFALRSRADNSPVAVAILVADPTYANPKQVDAAMPCFRLGAFGTEGENTKRINGLFSFLAPERDISAAGLDLMGRAAFKLEDTTVESLAAQVPSDAPGLFRFYRSHFRRQGSFPVLERAL